ncbi:molecular chaperone Hsp20 [Aliidongia dinghuensis]|uniref:Molecular chaperone Hsp20 n=1 Tax=Aliidongia dinghuensis TaxID=1867774 RepID=A0A8J3E498_9PROT|nr:Hsp20/alpha crystallin family protein [Aliidongia dinghuensis]GGF12753.1 molecular chaperone Hsp20 [Aliidongia dinghuensis]
MEFKDLVPWNRKTGRLARRDEGEHPILALHREMNRIFDNFWDQSGQPFGEFGGGFPRADVVETDKAVEVSLELPGLDDKDIDVSVTEDLLTIRGEKKAEREEREKSYFLSERSFGAFHRAIPLPRGVNASEAKAEYKKGVLTVTIPKTPEAQSKMKRIEVKAS